MIKDPQKNLLIEAWSEAHKGETFRLLVSNNKTDQNANLIAALRHFERAVEGNSNFIWAIAHKGLVNRELENWDEAISDFQKVIDNARDNPWGYAQLGDTYRQKMARTSNPDKLKNYAIDNFKKAIDLYPRREYAWAHAHLGATYCHLGSIYSRREDWEQAKISLDTAIEQTQKSYAWAHAYRAVVEYKGFNNITKALEYYHIARALDPRVFPHGNYQIAMLYQLNGEYDKATVNIHPRIPAESR
jgi:tetratricopeptide (TPR) repeat protein